MDLCDHNCVILRKNIAMCTIYKDILDLLDEEMFLERSVVELVYQFYEQSSMSV